MKGAIFKLLEDFVTTTHGPDAFDDLLDETELETTEPFVGPGTYPPGDLLALVGTATQKYNVSVDDLLRAFGKHAFPALANSVSSLIEGMNDPHTFLLNLESVIHTEVRKLDHDASPARFTVTEVSPTELRLNYESPFGLFSLVEGFLEGVADWYNTSVEHEIESVDGTNAVFNVRFPELTVGAGASAGQRVNN
ncbi:MAG: heme NO-binding domain-containing protein [Acidimicrobiales bacterium]